MLYSLAAQSSAGAADVCFVLARGPGDLERIEQSCAVGGTINALLKPLQPNSDMASTVVAQFCDFSSKIEISGGPAEGTLRVLCVRAKDTPRRR